MVVAAVTLLLVIPWVALALSIWGYTRADRRFRPCRYSRVIDGERYYCVGYLPDHPHHDLRRAS